MPPGPWARPPPWRSPGGHWGRPAPQTRQSLPRPGPGLLHQGTGQLSSSRNYNYDCETDRNKTPVFFVFLESDLFNMVQGTKLFKISLIRVTQITTYINICVSLFLGNKMLLPIPTLSDLLQMFGRNIKYKNSHPALFLGGIILTSKYWAVKHLKHGTGNTLTGYCSCGEAVLGKVGKFRTQPIIGQL